MYSIASEICFYSGGGVPRWGNGGFNTAHTIRQLVCFQDISVRHINVITKRRQEAVDVNKYTDVAGIIRIFAVYYD